MIPHSTPDSPGQCDLRLILQRNTRHPIGLPATGPPPPVAHPRRNRGEKIGAGKKRRSSVRSPGPASARTNRHLFPVLPPLDRNLLLPLPRPPTNNPQDHSPLPIAPILFTMASRGFTRALRSQLARQMAAPAVQQRTLATAGRSLARTARPAVVGSAQQVRGLKTMDFAGHKEDVYG